MPIKSPSLARTIRKEFLKIVSDNIEKVDKFGKRIIDSEGEGILKSRIGDMNKLTNTKKLKKPFELFKFVLTKEDMLAIKHRNDFLHGRITLGIHSEDNGFEIYYIALRLYTLLSVLILKSIDYDNYIVNYPKIHEDVCKKKIDESHFRKI